MKKMNYVRPLAEVVELDAQDIIRTSDFWQDTSGASGTGKSTKVKGYINFGTSGDSITIQ